MREGWLDEGLSIGDGSASPRPFRVSPVMWIIGLPVRRLLSYMVRFT
jgi:hypothetical protein